MRSNDVSEIRLGWVIPIALTLKQMYLPKQTFWISSLRHPISWRIYLSSLTSYLNIICSSFYVLDLELPYSLQISKVSLRNSSNFLVMDLSKSGYSNLISLSIERMVPSTNYSQSTLQYLMMVLKAALTLSRQLSKLTIFHKCSVLRFGRANSFYRFIWEDANLRRYVAQGMTKSHISSYYFPLTSACESILSLLAIGVSKFWVVQVPALDLNLVLFRLEFAFSGLSFDLLKVSLIPDFIQPTVFSRENPFSFYLFLRLCTRSYLEFSQLMRKLISSTMRSSNYLLPWLTASCMEIFNIMNIFNVDLESLFSLFNMLNISFSCSLFNLTNIRV